MPKRTETKGKQAKVTEDLTKWNEPPKEDFILRLYVSGPSIQSVRAINNIKAIFKQYLPDRCDLKIIDIHRSPAAARSEQIIAAPTLVIVYPPPVRRMIGDLSNTGRVLVNLGLFQR